MAILLVQLPCYIYLLYQLTLEANSVNIAMIIIYTSNLTLDAINFMAMISDLETSFISVERCVKFEQIDPENNYFDFYRNEQKMINLPTVSKK